MWLFLINSIALGAGLAMDAFSVSIANGLREPYMRKRKRILVAGSYGLFQFAMPMIGFFVVKFMASAFDKFDRIIPWTALILLLFIGGKMIYESVTCMGKEECVLGGKVTPGELLMQDVATSIDALSVGFTIAAYTTIKAATASLIIGAVTFILCLIGLRVGSKFGMKLGTRAQIIGGIILIAIGIEIFITNI